MQTTINYGPALDYPELNELYAKHNNFKTPTTASLWEWIDTRNDLYIHPTEGTVHLIKS